MNLVYHKNLSQERWFSMRLVEQMANIGSEIERTIKWRHKNEGYSERAFERALELLDLTIDDRKNLDRLKELTRLREALADHFVFDNSYESSDKSWHKYFFAFNFAVRLST